MPSQGSCPGFIPPYILHRLIDHGSEWQRSRALNTLTHVRQLLPNPGKPGPAPVAPIAGALQRNLYDAGHLTVLPGDLVRGEGQRASGDAAVDEAYDALGATHDFFWQVYGRDSIDNRGLALVGTVHYGEGYDNAFWNGAQMVFGDGDGEVFQRFTRSLDVVAHELTHGIIESEAGLVYRNQSGALNESISDVFGVLTRQYVLKQTAEQADWLIGADLLTDKVQGKGLRSMSHPGTAYDDPVLGKDPQPAHMRDFVVTQDDNGGVHLNSGIPNRAFYLAATALGGSAWEQAGQVWYDTLCDEKLDNDADFQGFAALTVAHARERFGATQAKAVEKAWAGVGVSPG
ncbi:M4 family metallopeptidase [Pseudomonas sp. SED1]|uniref:M4 family metallopeptidase n=1 Tax=Pseudomonas sp. SED1 TaxID=3056845 RepID=UPI0029700779|nr:M4 family metallopeptidase [Pseudomonas sp. SED1]MDY0831678.1 M4 family metallopeptidase [Pseudomonas sp. SED1]